MNKVVTCLKKKRKLRNHIGVNEQQTTPRHRFNFRATEPQASIRGAECRAKQDKNRTTHRT
jgi:hypothetical protein